MMVRMAQFAIIAGFTAFCVYVIFPTMDEPIGLHVPVIVGALFAVGFTYAASDLSAWWRKRRVDREFKRRGPTHRY